jgi:hypothetical protein
MGSRLDTLLASIHPDRTIEENERRANDALNSFTMPGGTVPDWPVFRDCVTRFVCHAENVMLRPRHPLDVNPAMHFGKACRLLMKAFGPDGEKTAASMAIYGVEGGLYHVLKTLAQGLAKEFSGNTIGGRVSAYLNSLSVEEKLAAAKEYLEEYGHLLPADVTDGGAARVLGFFPKFLQSHPEFLRRLRNVGR